MKLLTYLRYATYTLLFFIIAVTARDRQFIEFTNFPWMNERFLLKMPEGEEAVWMREFSHRTNALNNFQAIRIARSRLLEMGADDNALFDAVAVLQRGAKHGVYVVVYRQPILISQRLLLCVRITEDRLADVAFID